MKEAVSKNYELSPREIADKISNGELEPLAKPIATLHFGSVKQPLADEWDIKVAREFYKGIGMKIRIQRNK